MAQLPGSPRKLAFAAISLDRHRRAEGCVYEHLYLEVQPVLKLANPVTPRRSARMISTRMDHVDRRREAKAAPKKISTGTSAGHLRKLPRACRRRPVRCQWGWPMDVPKIRLSHGRSNRVCSIVFYRLILTAKSPWKIYALRDCPQICAGEQ